MSLDQAALSTLIRDAARAAFGDLRRAHPQEAFYAFALYTDEGWMTIVPAANSEEGFRRATGEGMDPVNRRYYRWATAEWAYETAGDEHFDAANALLNTPPPGAEPTDEEADEAEEAEEARRYREKGDALLGSMVEGLRLLDAEGFFGTGEAREAVTLFVSISDSDEAEALETSSARQLNPPAVAAAFAARYA